MTFFAYEDNMLLRLRDRRKKYEVITYDGNTLLRIREVAFMTIMSVINQKGGVGKTTTVLSIGARLAAKKKKVLLIDFDSSGNLTLACKGEGRGVCTAYEMMMKTCTAEDAVQNMPGGYDLIAANTDLAGAEGQITDAVGKIYRLRECLSEIKDKYDWIIIDTPPNLGYLTVNALIASTDVLIPSEPDFLSASGILDLVDSTIRSIKNYANSNLRILGIVFTKYTANTNNSKAMSVAIKSIAENYGIKIFKTVIRNNVAVKNSQSEQRDIFQFNAYANAAKDYAALVDEIMREVKKNS